MQRKLDIGGIVFIICAGLAGSALLSVAANPLGAQAQAQAGISPASTEPKAPQSFEVASIKPSTGDPRMIKIGNSPGGRWTASGVTVKVLIQQAYDIRDFQISGGPSWISSERYDIVAKAETPDVDRELLKVLLQSLLRERFNLQVHRETKELPVYALLVGKNGHKLKVSEFQPPPPGDGTPANANRSGGAGIGVGGAAGGAIAKGGSQMRMGRGQLNLVSAPMSLLAAMLAQQLGRPVIDKTELKGNFDCDLVWTPDETQRGIGPGAVERPENPAPVDTSGPSIFTAVQEQLGLRLDAQKGPVETLVIDRVEKPSGN